MTTTPHTYTTSGTTADTHVWSDTHAWYVYDQACLAERKDYAEWLANKDADDADAYVNDWQFTLTLRAAAFAEAMRITDAARP